MVQRGQKPVSFAVEGIVDQAVVLKLFEASGVVSGTPYVCDGIGNLRQRLDGFNAGAHYSPGSCSAISIVTTAPRRCAAACSEPGRQNGWSCESRFEPSRRG